MDGGKSALLALRQFDSKAIPLSWWWPQKERALLALAGAAFWTASIFQAIQHDASGASILAFYGLGLLYIICSLANLISGLTRSLERLKVGQAKADEPRALAQLLIILMAMLLSNGIVLAVYLSKGITLTGLDIMSIVVAIILFVWLVYRYGQQGVFTHPYSRGYLAMTFKALPQLLLAYLFIAHPPKAHAMTLWALTSLALMAGLRFWPSFLAYRRDRGSAPLRGLLLGETGNSISVMLLLVAWSWATWIAM